MSCVSRRLPWRRKVGRSSGPSSLVGPTPPWEHGNIVRLHWPILVKKQQGYTSPPPRLTIHGGSLRQLNAVEAQLDTSCNVTGAPRSFRPLPTCFSITYKQADPNSRYTKYTRELPWHTFGRTGRVILTDKLQKYSDLHCRCKMIKFELRIVAQILIIQFVNVDYFFVKNGYLLVKDDYLNICEMTTI